MHSHMYLHMYFKTKEEISRFRVLPSSYPCAWAGQTFWSPHFLRLSSEVEGAAERQSKQI